jgi:hypothetical protein
METTVESAVVCEAHAAQWTSSLRKSIDSNCKFGTYRAPTTKSISATSANLQPSEFVVFVVKGYREFASYSEFLWQIISGFAVTRGAIQKSRLSPAGSSTHIKGWAA